MSIAVLLVKITIVLALPLLAWPLLRRRSAATRHLAWSWALCGVLVLPALAAILPAWSLPPLRAKGADVARPVGAAPTVTPRVEPPASVPGLAHAVRGAAESADRLRSARQGGLDGALEAGRPRPRNLRRTPHAVPPASPSRPPAPGRAVPWAQAALAAWAVVAAAFLARLAVAGVRLRALRGRSAAQRDAAWTDDLAAAAEVVGVSRVPRLLVSEELASPCVVGIVRPAILLPPAARTWDASRRRAVLLHELSHVARRDGLDILLGRIALAAAWFHPLAWLAERRCRVERERACDDAVLRHGGAARRYAGDLLAIARAGRPLRSAVAMAQPSGLEERVRSILDDAAPRNPASRSPLRPLAALALAGAVAAAQAAPAPGRDAIALTVETGMTVDAAAMAKHVGAPARVTRTGIEWEERLVDSGHGDWPRWLSPHAEGIFAPDFFSTLPGSVTIRYELGLDGTLTVGASGPVPDVLCVLAEGGVSTPIGWGSSLPEGRAITHGLLGLDARSTLLAFLAYEKMLSAAEAGAVSGGPALVESQVNGRPEGSRFLRDFDLLPFSLTNRLGRPVTVVQAAVFASQPDTRFAYGGPVDGLTFTDAPSWPIQSALNDRWDPLHAPATDGIRVRQVALSWNGVEHSYVSCRAHGDNGNFGHVRLDGAMTKSFRNWEESSGTVRLPDAQPRQAELALAVAWSNASASLRAVALGGSLSASLPGEDMAPDRWVIPAD